MKRSRRWAQFDRSAHIATGPCSPRIYGVPMRTWSSTALRTLGGDSRLQGVHQPRAEPRGIAPTLGQGWELHVASRLGRRTRRRSLRRRRPRFADGRIRRPAFLNICRTALAIRPREYFVLVRTSTQLEPHASAWGYCGFPCKPQADAWGSNRKEKAKRV